MEMTLNGLPVSECIKTFEISSRRAFYRKFPSLGSTLSFVMSFFVGSLYSASNLQEEFRKEFGDQVTLMDHSVATEKGIKVMITVTGVPNAELIFTNYNGVGSRSSEFGTCTWAVNK